MKGYLLLSAENKTQGLDSSPLTFWHITLGIYSCKPLWEFKTFLWLMGYSFQHISDRCASRQGYDIQRNRQRYELLAQKCISQTSPAH